MKSASNLSQLLELGTASSTAISAPDRASLTYAGLRELANRPRESLNASGIGRTDRVAIVLAERT